jgi:multiple sugar transport system permease protein
VQWKPRVHDRLRIQYGTIAAALVLSIIPTLVLASRAYLVEGLSLGAVKG